MNVNSVSDIRSFLGLWQGVARPFENLVSRQTGRFPALARARLAGEQQVGCREALLTEVLRINGGSRSQNIGING